MKKYCNFDTDTLIIAACAIAEFENKIQKTDDYADSVMLSFEVIQFPGPIGYDRVLSNLYGNYMEFPPVTQRGLWHNDLLIDVDKPYNEFLLQYREEHNNGGL